jgi:amidase
MKKFGCFVCKSFLLGLASIALSSGCSLLPSVHPRLSGNRAFIAYWPPAENTNKLRLAVKDNIDMKGVVTTAGSKRLDRAGVPAEKDASCLAIARQRNVQIVGKANMSEFAVAPSGFNEYFGTPESPLSGSRKLLAGGSSCGSAVAVASGMADVAFGTDTAGSIRVPAAWCGVVGLKTTHGLIPIDGVFPIEPEHLDTVGPMGKDISHTVQGMDLLQNGFAALYAAAVAANPSAGAIRIGRLTLTGTDPKIDQAVDEALAKTGFQVIPLDDGIRKEWERAKTDGNVIAAAGAWISDSGFLFKGGVTGRTKTSIRAGGIAYLTSYGQAVARQADWQNTLKEIFTKVDFIALPTVQTPPLPIPSNSKIGLMQEAQMLDLQNTVAVNFAGNPAVALPIPLDGAEVAVTSLQLIAPPLGEAQLLNAGRLVEAAVNAGDLIQKGDVFYDKLQAAEALKFYLPAEKLDPKNVRLLVRISRQYRHLMSDATKASEKLQLGNTAVVYAQRAVALAPNDPETQLALAISCGKMLPLEGTKQQIANSRLIKIAVDKVIALDPDNDLAWHVLGRWYQALADVGTVKRALAQVAYGKLPPAKHEDAVRCFAKAILLNPDRLMHYIELGRTYSQMGRDADARKYITKGLAMPETEKDDPETKNLGRQMLKKLR